MVLDKIDEKLTLEMIKEWHASLIYRTRLYDMGLAGVFKKYQNRILGAKFDTANPWEVEYKLNKNNLSAVKVESNFPIIKEDSDENIKKEKEDMGIIEEEVKYKEEN